MQPNIDKIVEAFKTLYSLLPSWPDSEHRRFTVLLSRETWIEYNPTTKILKIKIENCPNCGECCMQFTPDSHQSTLGVDEKGVCKALYRDGDKLLCGANHDMPYRCLVAPRRTYCPYYDDFVREVKID